MGARRKPMQSEERIPRRALKSLVGSGDCSSSLGRIGWPDVRGTIRRTRAGQWTEVSFGSRGRASASIKGVLAMKPVRLALSLISIGSAVSIGACFGGVDEGDSQESAATGVEIPPVSQHPYEC